MRYELYKVKLIYLNTSSDDIEEEIKLTHANKDSKDHAEIAALFTQ